MEIRYETIPHSKHRYRTVGDYYRLKGVWFFRVSRMKDKRYCWLVFLHEIIEWGICRVLRIDQALIDRFDMLYERHRETPGATRACCGCPFQEEPGNDVHAPYHIAHQVATKCELLIADVIGVDWVEYEDAINALGDNKHEA